MSMLAATGRVPLPSTADNFSDSASYEEPKSHNAKIKKYVAQKEINTFSRDTTERELCSINFKRPSIVH
jgi:hypothetical protein